MEDMRSGTALSVPYVQDGNQTALPEWRRRAPKISCRLGADHEYQLHRLLDWSPSGQLATGDLRHTLALSGLTTGGGNHTVMPP